MPTQLLFPNIINAVKCLYCEESEGVQFATSLRETYIKENLNTAIVSNCEYI